MEKTIAFCRISYISDIDVDEKRIDKKQLNTTY